jgi:putative methionine-R-sulfoxide reductase with GAF domain
MRKACPLRPRPDAGHARGASKRTVEGLRQWQRKLFTLLRYARQAPRAASLDELLRLLIAEAKELLSSERATVFLIDERNLELCSRAASGGETIRFPISMGIAGAVAASGRPLNVEDAYADPRFNPEVDRRTGFKTRSIATSPMFDSRGKVIGVFQALNKQGSRRFDRRDEEVLSLLSEQASAQIENARLHEELRKSAQETLSRLAAAAEYKDPDAAAHIRRMSRCSAMIAKAMGLAPERVENIRLASQLHDVGKIGVPDAILRKSGPLTPEERESIRRHPAIGADILKDCDNELLRLAATIALRHHEKWDGSGYPGGLAGEDIPLEGRITALADVFDALTSKRVYKPAFPPRESIETIKSESGKHFDPRVVQAFLRGLASAGGLDGSLDGGEEAPPEAAEGFSLLLARAQR